MCGTFVHWADTSKELCILIHSYIKHTFTELFLCTKHSPRYWRFRKEQNAVPYFTVIIHLRTLSLSVPPSTLTV